MMNPESVPVVLGAWQEKFSVYGAPVRYKAPCTHIFTHPFTARGQFIFSSPSTGMFFRSEDYGKTQKKENVESPHASDLPGAVW